MFILTFPGHVLPYWDGFMARADRSRAMKFANLGDLQQHAADRGIMVGKAERV